MKKRRHLRILIVLLICTLAQAQVSKSEMLLANILTEVRSTNKERAFFLVDSIYKNDADIHVKIHALFIHAYLYHDEFNIPTSLQFAFQAIDLAEKNKSYKWLSRLYGFVGAEYSRLGLFSEAMLYFDKIEAIIPLVSDEHDRNFSHFYYYHLLSAYYYEQKSYNEALLSIQRAESYIAKVGTALIHYNHYMCSIEQNKGINYLELKQYDKAEKAYEKGYEYIMKEENIDDFLALGYIYAGLAKVYGIQQKPVTANQILDYYYKGLHIAILNDNRDLKEICYDYLREYYETVGDWENYSKYNKLYLDERHEKEEFRTKTVNELLEQQHLFKEEITYKNKKYLVVIVSFLVVLLIAPGIYFLLRRKKKSKNQEEEGPSSAFLQKLAQAKESELASFFQGVSWYNIPCEEDERAVVEALMCFEQERGFVDSTITLEALAESCQVTPTALAKVLQQHKQVEFKMYLTQLRLCESVKLMRFEKEYREYKISHLAEVVGFGSHSSFSIEFKKSIGVNPSFFIQYLEEIEKK
ncbi:helix-turn-helix transcriptional regulator [Myroides sp. 1354]|uniref:helix-turn-helix transcriptional regulator n=1 Tax=unclassified Myroides TaxID=2642485 RepID=UPI0025763FBA|nr:MULTISPECIES: helix-turn-helix transcriptional regulator [unclassified Myroides]MDM1046109.1 helix-turn-helix transcriptional regulator [Myroides sp. R163-1]MDM1057068.1 helix-turn-helix transcriptional regulator [Myroides sp. 1354]MDM1070240.1 helix-turn-helix transcriptional regulator [Myroides sp. 1372]